jgi:outer membrane protein assembly factor BamB
MDYRTAPPSPLVIVSTSVTALDRESGKELWTYRVGNATRRFAFDEQRMFVLCGGGFLHCLDIATGRLLGKVDLQLQTTNNLLVDGERTYVSSDTEVVAVDPLGNVLWRARTPQNGSYSLGGLGIPGHGLVQPDFSTSG